MKTTQIFTNDKKAGFLYKNAPFILSVLHSLQEVGGLSDFARLAVPPGGAAAKRAPAWEGADLAPWQGGAFWSLCSEEPVPVLKSTGRTDSADKQVPVCAGPSKREPAP